MRKRKILSIVLLGLLMILFAGCSSGDGDSSDGTKSGNTIIYITDVKAIATGDNHAVALKNDGTIWAWGCNSNGQLGDGTYTDRYTPVKVNNLTGITAIAAGGANGFDFSLALKNDGTVWAWGYNEYYQLGDGTKINRYIPVEVPGLTDIIAIAAGGNHAVALKNDGTVWVWGPNDHGTLGDGTTTDKYTAVRVSGLTGVTAVTAGYLHTVALKDDGTVWAWGLNYTGQLGDGTTTDRYAPVQVIGLNGITSIKAKGTNTIALRNDGTVWGWGLNGWGQLGDGTVTSRYTPVQVMSIADVLAIHSDDAYHGNGMEMVGLTGIAAIEAGCYDTFLLGNNGTVWGWGDNSGGQLGNGTKINRYVIGLTTGLYDVKAIAAGTYTTYAVKNDGTVWAWGSNYAGQLGDGTTTDKYSPVQVHK
jgi:alpha-tubulin suppressor-like RCC1 family protein